MEEDGLSSGFSTFSPILSSQQHLQSQHFDQSLDQTLELQSQQIQTQLESHLLTLPSQQQLPEPSTALIPTSSSSSVPTSSSSAPSVPTSSETRGRSRQPSTRRRTKLSSQERAKILEVRRQRACLRCKMLKIQCSKENPCKPCLSSAVRGYERKVLSFCYCVRTRFVDVDIFQRSESGPPPEIPPSIKALMDQVERPTLPPGAVEESSSSSSATPSTSSTPSASATATHDVFEDTLLRWLTSPDHAPPEGTSSIVALLYDLVGHADSLRAAVDDRLPADFQTFLFTTSLAHTGWRGGNPHVTHRDLCIAGHVCGSRIVRRLDRILTPQFLAKCDRTTHRALLLLVFGVILGVSYSTRLTTSPSFPHDLLGAEMRHSPTLWLAMKEHLAQMLAHHLIFLGSTLGIKLDTAAEKTIIDTAVDRWHKPERSLWAGFSGASLNLSTPTATPMQIPVSLSEDTMIARTFGARLGDFNSFDTLPSQYHDHTRPRTIGSPSLSTVTTTTTTAPASASVSGTATATATGSPSMMSRMARMSIVALSDPDLLQLQAVPPMSDDDYSANPESFYNMDTHEVPDMSLVGTGPTDLDFSRGLAHPGGHQPNRMGDPNDGGTPHTRKKRSVWIVRPFDDGGHRDPVSVFARFQLQRGQNLGLFV